MTVSSCTFVQHSISSTLDGAEQYGGLDSLRLLDLSFLFKIIIKAMLKYDFFDDTWIFYTRCNDAWVLDVHFVHCNCP